MQAFVTGGSGFVGRHLIRALRARGDAVNALARSDAAAKVVREAGATQVVRGDLDDVQAMADGMVGCDTVFHSAAIVSDWGDAELFHRVNVVGTQNALDAAIASGVSRFVHISTEAVLLGGPPIVAADETWPRAARPLGLYATTKGLAEGCVIAANGEALKAVIVRPRFVWGPGDTSLLPQFVAAVREGNFLWVAHGRYPTSTCHVDNTVEGALLADEHGRGAEIYFLTDGAPIEFREFIGALLASQGVDAGTRSVPRWFARAAAWLCEAAWKGLRLKGRPPLTRSSVRLVGESVTVDDGKARRELGYRACTTRAEGLAALHSRA